MSSKKDRVLNRIGAHELTREEIDNVVGAHISTRVSFIVTGPTSNPDHSIDT
jgi:hypothetical protein